jgi:hypothetical protein
VTPAYVVRGRETEACQHAYHDRIERFYQTLSEHLRDAAPDLLETLAAPPPDVHGYQILAESGGRPRAARARNNRRVVSFSWRWSDTLIEREMVGLERLESGLAQVPPDAGRPRDEKLAADYRAAVARRRRIDADIQYNWRWQAHIDRDRPLFDRLKTIQDAVLERQAIEAAIAYDEAALRRAAARFCAHRASRPLRTARGRAALHGHHGRCIRRGVPEGRGNPLARAHGGRPSVCASR